MTALQLISIDTPDGPFRMIADGQGVVRASGFGGSAALAKRLPLELQTQGIEAAQVHPYQQYVLQYYKGEHTALDKIPRAQTGSAFQEKVWTAMAAIPYGRTASYKQLAEMAGKPAAVRAVGTVCGRNRLIPLVPCHRVLKSDGSIGSYLYGPDIKASLLRHEGVKV